MGMVGKYHTLNSSIHPGSQRLAFEFPTNLKIKIRLVIHDPDLYFVTPNPATFPRIIYEMEENYHLLYIEVIHHVKMSREGSPCEENGKYSFTLCLKKSVTDKIGCRLKLLILSYDLT